MAACQNSYRRCQVLNRNITRTITDHKGDHKLLGEIHYVYEIKQKHIAKNDHINMTELIIKRPQVISTEADSFLPEDELFCQNKDDP